ncbi:hypothetical protein MTsPCn9_25480 [Croceitalea sp. MTPC9]|uniref:hypothetical protein n=1 Tax=unclassified Croceitalea TaxID=2632280 RepID=UPI002B3B65C7|nr:hypothetical protein MTsPCn6_29050 [Croceitalea sp. MTPC6]GMN17610.1 hypothetical protein MTsPCn9_25480 [Croceitalea sp. MTPC9]
MSKEFLKRLREDPEYFEFWQDLREYSKDLDIPDNSEFVETLPALFKKIENDGAGYYIYEGLNKYAQKKPSEGVKLFKLIEKKSTKETLTFSASILSGLSKSKTSFDYKKKILEFLGSKDANKISAGVDAAYRSIIADKEEEKKFLNEVHNKLQKVLDDEPKDCLGIITRFYNKNLNNISGAKEVVLRLLELKNVVVQSEVARSLNEEFKPDEDIEFFRKCLSHLTYVDVKYKGVYNTIRFRLKDITKSNPQLILDFLNEWVLNNKRKLKGITVLEGITQELYFEHPEAIKNMFLDWLNSENHLFKFALPFVISNLSSNIDAVGLPKESLKKLSEKDSLYVVYMIVGHILDRKYASEMLYSILEVNHKSERIRNHIASLFAKYLIINYYSVTEILKKKRDSANKTIKSVIDQIIESSENYYKQFSELQMINEFEASDKRMQYFLKQQNIQIQKLMDDSEKKRDSFLSMLTNINLRAGKSFFSKYRGEYTQESEMQNFRSSFEVARVQSIDEIGQEKLRLMWQNRTRDEFSD